jgi:hypothetical protein
MVRAVVREGRRSMQRFIHIVLATAGFLAVAAMSRPVFAQG